MNINFGVEQRVIRVKINQKRENLLESEYLIRAKGYYGIRVNPKGKKRVRVLSLTE